ncbi:DUF72 domain-containing protein [Salinispira pacifica]
MEKPSVLVATSGYSYKDWIGPVYPPGLRQPDFLAWYAERLPFVELDFSYYTMPNPRTLEAMVARTPDSFGFTLKAHRSMTHEREADPAEVVRTFLDRIAPFVESGRLLGLLLQFPFRFHYTTENRRYLAALCEGLSPHRLFVEFRNRDWHHDRVYDYMRERSLNLVLTDLPRLRELPDFEPVVTGPASYVRLHGRNRAEWWSGDNASRYNYRYSPEEVAELAAVIRAAAEKATLMLVAFNNHFGGNAFHNAVELEVLLQSGGGPAPHPA